MYIVLAAKFCSNQPYKALIFEELTQLSYGESHTFIFSLITDQFSYENFCSIVFFAAAKYEDFFSEHCLITIFALLNGLSAPTCKLTVYSQIFVEETSSCKRAFLCLKVLEYA